MESVRFKVLAKFRVDPVTGSNEYLHIAAPQLLRVTVLLCQPVPEFGHKDANAFTHGASLRGVQVHPVQELATAYETTTLTAQIYNT